MSELNINNINADLHNHTRSSDGLQSPFRTMLRAYHSGFNVIAFTDHDSIGAFEKFEMQLTTLLELVKETPSDASKVLDVLENIKVLKGTELITSYNGVIVEVLGYNYDLDKMKVELDNLKSSIKEKNYEVLYKSFKEIVDKNNLVFDKSVLDNAYLNIKNTGRGGVTGPFFNELISHEENMKYLKYVDENGQEQVANTLKLFINKHLYKLGSPFFVDMTNTKPTFTDTINAIHNAGGLAFLAHAGRYKDKMDVENYLDDMINCGLDGLEVFYPDHSYEFRQMLLEKVRKHNIKASGGSDDHHSIKEGIQYHTGKVAIPNINETEWIVNSLNANKDFASESIVYQNVVDELRKLKTQRKM